MMKDNRGIAINITTIIIVILIGAVAWMFLGTGGVPGTPSGMNTAGFTVEFADDEGHVLAILDSDDDKTLSGLTMTELGTLEYEGDVITQMKWSSWVRADSTGDVTGPVMLDYSIERAEIWPDGSTSGWTDVISGSGNVDLGEKTAFASSSWMDIDARLEEYSPQTGGKYTYKLWLQGSATAQSGQTDEINMEQHIIFDWSAGGSLTISMGTDWETQMVLQG